jgi:FKBP-type peptidyl-prolyl cis-trans isomerase
MQISKTLAALSLPLALGLPSLACTKNEADVPTQIPVARADSSLTAAVKAAETAPAAGNLTAPADVAAAPADASKTPSGLASKVLRAGTGATHPTADDTVEVHYTGWTTDGKMFDSSVARGAPISFPLKRVIKGWTEGVQLMVEGEKRRFWIPAELGYGLSPPPGTPAGMLVFDVELLHIAAAPKALPAPPDVAAIPKDAKKTPTGLAIKVLQKGTGKRHPKASDQVQVHYTGWTTDGKMFDSSVRSGKPATFPLDGVIKGWTQGVQLMTEGEKARFWIPAQLAYGNQPGRPNGMLVFDIELLKIL